jgi:16S rRNA U516 pseudouridylate synthase RsuA-like enzyme
MMEAVGYTVLDLHRIEFGEIKLSSLKREGDWERLNGKELASIETLLQNAE